MVCYPRGLIGLVGDTGAILEGAGTWDAVRA